MTATPSARRTRWYRIPLVLLCVAASAPVWPAGPALADATVASPTPAEPCQSGELDLSPPPPSIPAVYAPGQVDTQQLTVHNPTSARFTDASFEFQLTPTGIIANATTIPPSVSWSIDGSGSAGMTFRWFSTSPPADPFWRADAIALPTLAAGSTHTLRFQASFHADSQAGWYDIDLVITTQTCHFYPLAESLNMAFIYYTAAGRGGLGSHSSPPSGHAGGGKPASLPPTAPGSATPGAPSASPTSMDSVDTVTAAGPSASATPTPQQASGALTKGPPEVAWLGGLVLLAAAALVSLWRQVVNSGRMPGPARLRSRRRDASRRLPGAGADDDLVDRNH